MAKSKMPPQLLAHFKKKQEGGEGSREESREDVNKSDKDRRKEAVKKARIRLEEKSRKSSHDKEKETGKESAEKS